MKITNERFTIRFCRIAQYYGITTVGKFKNWLKAMQPHCKLYTLGGYYSGARASKLLKEIERFELSRQTK